MTDKYIFDPNRNIGTVIFVVEGGRPEFSGTELKLLKAIFADLLGYEVQELIRGQEEFIAHGSNSFSKVFALNLPKNQLTQLNDDSLDELFKRLKQEFRIKPEDCPIFFIYDRDYKSYKNNELRGKYVKRYVDPYSDDEGNQGQLLLSYPCVESYILSLTLENAHKIKYGLGKDLKKDQELHQNIKTTDDINGNMLIHAVNEMNKGLQSLKIDEYDIDNLAPVFLEAYAKQQENYLKHKSVNLLSFVSMALLELGIIQPEEDE